MADQPLDYRFLKDLPCANGLAPDGAVDPDTGRITPNVRQFPYRLNLTGGAAAELDLTQAQIEAIEKRIQKIWVDNSGNSAPLICSQVEAGFNYRVEAGDRAMITLIVSGSKFRFYSERTATVNVNLLNVPLPDSRWEPKADTAQAFSVTASGVILPAVAGRQIVVRRLEAYLSTNVMQGVAGQNTMRARFQTSLRDIAFANPHIPSIPLTTPGGMPLFATTRGSYIGDVGEAVAMSMSSLTGGSVYGIIEYTLQ